MTETTRHAAIPTIQGFLYQFYIALLEILNSDNPSALLSIESLDDIVIENNGTPEAIIQVKHHNKQSNLTNTSTDLWKTLNIWCDLLLQDKIEEKSVLYLITTQSITENTIAYYLSKKDIDEAKKAILKTIDSSNSSANKTYYDKFKDELTDEQKQFLLEHIYISDNHFSFDEVKKRLETKLELACRKEHIKHFVEQLVDWFRGRIADDFSKNKPANIKRKDITDKIDDLREQFKNDNLPTYDKISKEKIDTNEFNNHLFVKQINLLQLNNTDRIINAMADFYNARLHRSKWVSELLITHELEKYDDELIDKWKVKFNQEKENLTSNSTDEEERNIGKNVFNWIEKSEYSIRPNFTNKSFITRGSYHMLANNDDLKVGWHPKYKELLQSDNGENQ
ncbi:MAG: hypothetical protein IJ187_09570 [Neisseriaceae bacterium]|nr:hypothetical protein [Neisseriaceae bacterium]